MRRLFALALALLLAPCAWAQTSTGNIYGTVTDESGAVLPGAAVSIVATTIGGAPKTATAGSQGDFRFLNLDRGTYKLTVSMPGFATATREVIVTTGVNVNLSFSMKVARQQETVTVSGETPVVDTQKVGTATTLSTDELTKIPQGRDPWAVLNQVPGVLVDRVSIAGNEAGQQSIFVGKGAQFTDTMWNLDGVAITDTTSYGATSTYFDYDAFQEINVTTGGGDLKVQTGGLGLNFVTKRGTNSFHGGARLFGSNHKYGESKNVPSEISRSSTLVDGRADQIRQIADYGADLGGPLIKDKLWFWGSFGRNDIRLYRYTSASQDKTILLNWNAKVNWQAGSKDMMSFFFFNGAKQKFGRSPGFAGSEADSFLWNQGNFYPEEKCGLPCGLHGLFKLEDNHVFSNNFFLNAKYAYYGWGYGFDPRGGSGQNGSIDRVTDTAKGSSPAYRFTKPWHTVNLDGNYFVAGGGGNHELKFGFGYRHWPNTSAAAWGGDGIVAVRNNNDASDPASRVAWITRNGLVQFEGNTTSAYAGDTFTKGRLTLNAGARWDRQTAKNSASEVPANPAFPNLVPAQKFDGNAPTIKWNDISPRVSVTVALDEKRKTVARASYARYAGQLGPIDVTYGSPLSYGYSYLAYRWVDRNNDGFAQRDEILTGSGVVYASGTFSTSPTALNKIDPNYHANHDNEFVVGIDHELAPNFSVGAAYTWRKGTDLVDWTPRIDNSGRILTSADYVRNAPVTAGGNTVTTYSPNPARTGDGAHIMTNRAGFFLRYNGFEVTATKRLANKWMGRASFSWMDHTEHFSDRNTAIQNPTSVDTENAISQAGPNAFSGPGIEGGIVSPKSYGAKTNTFFNAKWQVSANALYQLPAGFEVGTALLGRQGYPRGITILTGLGADGTRGVLPGPLDLQRYENLWNLDFRLAKNQKLGGSTTFNITLDVFNVLNSDTVLQRNRRLTSSAFGSILEVINPRILRLGLRLSF